jgi:hypothetical protein
VKFFWFYIFMSIAMTRVARQWVVVQERAISVELEPAAVLVHA